MSSMLRASLLLVLLVPACGDDEPAVLTGVFVDSAVSGLHFATATQSGLTDADGTFRYIEGESVTFSVGDIVLGSATGASQLSPFDLFGLTPPADEATFRAAVNDATINDFDRVANIAAFLVALDADRDPSNGIDLADWDMTLAGATLDFSQDLREFFTTNLDRFAAGHPGVNRHVLVATPLRHLYESLGLSFTGHVMVKESLDASNDGDFDLVSHYDWDSQARLVAVHRDTDANGDDEALDTTTYDAQGRITVSDSRSDNNNDGVLEYRVVSTRTYSVDGNVVSFVTESFNGDVVGNRLTTISTFDAVGNELSSTFEQDNGSNGSIEARQTYTADYNTTGGTLTQTTETEVPADGTPNAQEVITSTYDAAGYESGLIIVNDTNHDGIPNTRYVYVITNDAHGRRLSEDRLYESAGVPQARRIVTNTYDANGLVLTAVIDNDSGADGDVDQRSITTNTYDAMGHVLSTVQDIDNNGDGVLDRRFRTIYTYDAAGNPLTQTATQDNNLDSVDDARTTRTWTYDASGNRLSELYEVDTQNDGAVDGRDRTVFEHAETPDGVGAVLAPDVTEGDAAVAA